MQWPAIVSIYGATHRYEGADVFVHDRAISLCEIL